MTVKNPGWGVWEGQAEARRVGGSDIRVVASENLAALKARAGVPAELQGCHTVLIGGYTVEGHVPVAAVERLLAQKPAVRGIALPGMPAGSPGMGGVQIGRAACRERVVSTCSTRWSPSHYKKK